MNEEHHKLIAKVQHFYDLMIHVAEQTEDSMIVPVEDMKRVKKGKEASSLNILIDEYTKVFDLFLYKNR